MLDIVTEKQVSHGKLNSKASKLVYVNAGTYPNEQYTYEEAAKDIIDNKLPNTGDTFYFVCFNAGSICRMIVQKYKNGNYASFILFGYGIKEIVYKVKSSGKWI